MKTKHYIRYIFILTFSLFYLASVYGQQSEIEKIADKYTQYDSLNYRQKVFLFSDKNEYRPGETVYFKTLVLDSENQPDTFARQIYVQILFPNQTTAYNQIDRLVNGESHGSIQLPDTASGGFYTLRAYTSWMLNFEHKKIPQKPIYIENDEDYFYSDALYKQTKKALKSQKKTEFDVLIEGGFLAADLPNTISVKPLFFAGNRSETCQFSISDLTAKQENVASASEEAVFYGFVPQKNHKYELVAKFEKKSKKISLPEAQTNVVKLRKIEETENLYRFKAESNKLESKDNFAKQLVLIARILGKSELYKYAELVDNQAEFEIQKGDLPAGNVTFLLCDLNGRILSEISTENKRQSKVRLSTKISPQDDSVFVNLKFSGLKLEKSSLAVSVNSEKYNLQFLKQNKKDSEYESFPKSALFENEYEQNYKNDSSLSISGKINKIIMDLPQEDAAVSLYVLNEYYKRMDFTTKDDGRFSFSGLDYQDTLELRIESRDRQGKKSYLIVVDDPYYPKTPKLFPAELVQEMDRLKNGRKQYRKQLGAVAGSSDSVSSEGLHNNANQILYFDKLNVSGYSNALEVIASFVPGVSEYGESALRGKNSLYLSSEPLYLLDGMPSSKETIGSLPPSQVERVEIVKGTNASIYGSRGSNGAIAVYTRRGYYVNIGEESLKIPGYHTPKAFVRNAEIENHCLFWDAHIQIEDDGSYLLKFPKSFSGNYLIDIEGFIDGLPFSESLFFP